MACPSNMHSDPAFCGWKLARKDSAVSCRAIMLGALPGALYNEDDQHDEVADAVKL